jgi:hypothetical protein
MYLSTLRQSIKSIIDYCSDSRDVLEQEIIVKNFRNYSPLMLPNMPFAKCHS